MPAPTPRTDAPETALEQWVTERLDNCQRIAATKKGADRSGWLEDAQYFLAILDALSDGKDDVKRLHSQKMDYYEKNITLELSNRELIGLLEEALAYVNIQHIHHVVIDNKLVHHEGPCERCELRDRIRERISAHLQGANHG
jgi:hypothetical protein